jgi:hypothetical protein
VFDRWSSACVRQKALTPMALFTPGRPRTERTLANGDALSATAKQRSWRNSINIARELGLF